MLKLSTINPTVLNFLMVGLMAVVFITVAKYVVNQYNIPLVKDTVNAL